MFFMGHNIFPAIDVGKIFRSMTQGTVMGPMNGLGLV